MNDLKPMYIIGAGGFGREVAWLVERVNAAAPTWDFKGFLDDDAAMWGMEIDGCKIHRGSSFFEQCAQDVWCVFAIGNAKRRRQGVRRLQEFAHVHFATLVDPGAIVGSRVSIGEGSVVCAGAILTVDISIGRHTIINLDCTIGHDAVLEDFVTVYPSANLSGCVRIGDTAEIGTGAQVIQGVEIGNGSVIGAGSVVIRDVEPYVTAVGSPARVVRR